MESSIIIEGMEFYAFHGFYPEEHKIGCKYSVDLTLDVDLTRSAQNDCLDDTINYEIVYTIVRREMNIQSALIENVAWRIANALKAEFNVLKKVKITLYKYNPPLGGALNRVAVQMEI